MHRSARPSDAAPPEPRILSGLPRLAGPLVLALALCGCGTGDPAAAEVNAEAAAAPQPAPPAPPAATEKNDFSGSRSVLGKAMEQAHKLEDKVDAYNKKIEDAAEGKHE